MSRLVLFISLAVILFGNVLCGGGKKPEKTSPYDKLSPQQLLVKGNELIKQRNYEEAKSALKKAIEKDPNFYDAYISYATALRKTQDYQEAMNVVDKAIKINPQNPKGFYEKSLIYVSMASNAATDEEAKAYYDNALAMIEKAISLINPSNTSREATIRTARYYTLKGYILTHLGKLYNNDSYLQQATEAYTQAILVLPNYYKAYYNRGMLYEMMGNLNQAIKDYRKVLEINPNHQGARTRLRRLGIIY